MPLYFFDTNALVKKYHIAGGLLSLNPTMVTSDEALFNATLKEGFSAIKP